MNNEEFLKYVLEKIEKLHEEVVKMREVSAAQHVVLVDHTRRSIANEESVKLLKEQYEAEKGLIQKELQDQLKPIQTHVTFVNVGLKILGAVAGFAAFVGIVFQIIAFFRN